MDKCVIAVICIILAAAICGGCSSGSHSMPTLKDTVSSEQYDIAVTVKSVRFDSEEKLDVAQCPSTITVYPKGDKKNPVGSVDLTIYFKADPRTHMPIYGQSIYCMDVDFDGHDDLVVWTIYFEDIKTPVYTVYLYDPAQKTFVQHKKLSDLCYSYHSDVLKVDKDRKRLIFYIKTGCCLRMWHEYIMADGEPVGVFSRTESLISDGRREWLEVSEGVPVEIGGDTWDWQKHEEPKPADYGDMAREMRPDYKP